MSLPITSISASFQPFTYFYKPEHIRAHSDRNHSNYIYWIFTQDETDQSRNPKKQMQHMCTSTLLTIEKHEFETPLWHKPTENFEAVHIETLFGAQLACCQCAYTTKPHGPLFRSKIWHQMFDPSRESTRHSTLLSVSVLIPLSHTDHYSVLTLASSDTCQFWHFSSDTCHDILAFVRKLFIQTCVISLCAYVRFFTGICAYMYTSHIFRKICACVRIHAHVIWSLSRPMK